LTLQVTSDELKNRKEVRAEDFRPRLEGGRSPGGATPPAATAADQEPSTEDLAARRASRSHDPDDVLTQRRQREATSPSSGADRVGLTTTGERARDSGRTEDPTPASQYHWSKLYVDTAPSGGAGTGAGAAVSLPAATILAATLDAPLALAGGGGSTVVATVHGGAVDGGRLVGSASIREDRVVVQFHKLVLADGRDASLVGEAQDVDGSFGLHGVHEGEASTGPSTGEQIATDSGNQVVDTLVGSTLPGQLVGNAVHTATRRSYNYGGSRSSASLPKGLSLHVFVQEAVTVAVRATDAP
jgi:hypothetical protein